MKALSLSIAALFASATLAFAETPPAPVPAPAMDPLAAAVLAYGVFQDDVTQLKTAEFATADETERAIDALAQGSPEALARGWIAYGAMTAAQSPTFVAEVRKVAQAYGRAVAVRGFGFGSDYVRSLKGADEAANLALAAAANDGRRAIDVGLALENRALELQRARWATSRYSARATTQRMSRLTQLSQTAPRALAPALAGRLTPAAATSAPASDPYAFGGRSFWDGDQYRQAGAPTATLTAFAPPALYQVDPSQTTALEVMLSLAALHALDAVDELPSADLDRLLNHEHTSNCFKMAQQQFKQCISAAASHSDAVACVGEAGLQTRGQCVSNVVASAASSSAALN